MSDWVTLVADDIRKEFPLTEERLREIINEHCPFKPDIDYISNNEPSGKPWLQCSDCHNTESPAGALAREWNHGRCVFCGAYFKVVRV